ncbi:hypothetical protein AMATHDRAFT_82439 [Amanita thiersii Skay4041]|uniref:Nicotinate phosphoribosyltransferase n=1 Tax=Amanita thiersii Skay4041 TaxID=703135 RepID=A0A2A9NEY0_9AGAR|nr:hypothetical protein AMATHDRAFT_82439 [Amanita thiersii Skay4041]
MSIKPGEIPGPQSILDTDLYKLTMQQAVLHYFPNVEARYQFTNRSRDMRFSVACIEQFRATVHRFSELSMTESEKHWLGITCPYLTSQYLTYLSAYRFKPEQVQITFIPEPCNSDVGDITIEISGPWVETILWEVPLMACLSEVYFQIVDTDWNYTGQEDITFEKAKTLIGAGCMFSEFGTRRRRSYIGQDIVIKSLVQATAEMPGKGSLSGTSNVHFAHKYAIAPIGTIAHEWFMGVAAMKGYKCANTMALSLWEQIYHPHATMIALTDTFSTGCFFNELSTKPSLMQRWHGVRQDSGDPYAFGPRAKHFYQSIGLNPASKTIVYSDALNVDKALRIKKQCEELGLPKVSFGIGTFFTNDFCTVSSGWIKKSNPLNIVIKLASVNNIPCVKISDDPMKNTGNKDAVNEVKHILNLYVAK